MTSPRTPDVDFWFDPSCPWAWMTSRWVIDVAAQRGFSPRWRIMSLSVLNEGTEHDEQTQVLLAQSLRYVRLVTAVEARHGAEHVGPLYTALGERIHPGGRSDADAIMTEALAEIGLPVEDLRYADSEEFDTELRASHAEGIARVGQDVGTPIIAVDGTAFFGPVVSPTPRGEAAVQMWDAVVALAASPGFFELKRSRTVGPIFA